jgi:hypothetical protein
MRSLTLILSLFLAASAPAASWYVDNAASGSNNGTSWANAWEAMDDVVWGGSGVAAGDTLYISGGSTSKTYTGARLTVGANGSSGNPITIRIGQDAGHNGVAILEGSGLNELIWWNGRSWIVIDGLYNGESRLHLQNIDNADRQIGFAINGNVNNSIVQWVTASNINNGIMVGNGTGNTIRSNLITHIKGDRAADFNGSTGSWDANKFHNNIVRINTTSDRSGAGPDGVQCTTGVSIYDNHFIGLGNDLQVGTQHPDGVQATRDYLKIYNNIFENFTDSGIDMDCWGNDRQRNNVHIFNNLFVLTDPAFRTGNRTPVGIRLYLPGNTITNLSNVVIANNAFVDYPSRAIYVEQVAQTCAFDGVKIVNNIFHNINKASSGSSAQIFNFGNISSPTLDNISTSNVQIDYNVFSAGGNGVTRFHRGTVLYNVGDWGGGIMDNGINADPLFVSYALEDPDNDYRLQSGSPAIGSGLDLSAFFTTDKDGNTRTAWDIGPYAFDGEADTTDPVVTITGPTSSATYDNGSTATITLSGTSSDNVSVSNVTLVMSGATTGSVSVTGTTTWTANEANINVGETTFTATATDSSSNTATDTLVVTRTEVAGPTPPGSGRRIPARSQGGGFPF